MRTRSACVDPVRIGGGGEDSSRHPSVQGASCTLLLRVVGVDAASAR